ncbi:transposase, MuDR, MULE transposase domain protein [Tanacetum coccineum]
MDGNNQIIPIATGVAQSETNESWTWFLSKLKDCIGEVPNLTIISDRHYAITHACKNVFPNSFHGYCCRHLMMNCNMQSDKLNGLYWKTCKAYTIPKFEKLISLILTVRPDSHRKLIQAGFSKWTRALCPTTRYNYMTSNSVESINALTKDVRKLPITQLMDWFRDLLQKWYYERRAKHQGTYSGIIYPLQDVSSWHTSHDFPLVLPPVLGKNLPGRPKKKDRIPSQGVFGSILKHNLTDDWFHVVILINYMLSAEVIILESDYDSPHSMNSDDTWEPGKDVAKNTSNSVSVKGRKGSTTKKVSCSKSTKTKPFKDLKFFDDSSSDDQGNVFRGKPGRTSVYSKGNKHSVSKKGSFSKKGSCSKGVVRGKPVESDVDSVQVIILESDYDSPHSMNFDDT